MREVKTQAYEFFNDAEHIAKLAEELWHQSQKKAPDVHLMRELLRQAWEGPLMMLEMRCRDLGKAMDSSGAQPCCCHCLHGRRVEDVCSECTEFAMRGLGLIE